MKITSKVLTASILISAVNINASYCMEDKNGSQMKVKDKTELHKALGMECSLNV